MIKRYNPIRGGGKVATPCNFKAIGDKEMILGGYIVCLKLFPLRPNQWNDVVRSCDNNKIFPFTAAIFVSE